MANAWLPTTQAQTGAAATTTSRTFPASARYGTLVIGDNTQATIDGKLVRTAPGLRVFDQRNALIHAHLVRGQKLKVNYVIEPSTGFLQSAWILNSGELPQSGWSSLFPTKPAPAQTQPLPTPRPVESATTADTDSDTAN